MKFLFFLLTSSLFFREAVAQENLKPGEIKGWVTDSVKNMPLGYATVSLREYGKTAALKSTYTQENGAFRFTGLAIMPYELIVSYVGFKDEIIQVNTLSETIKTVTLLTIKLQPALTQLKEVGVSAQKILVTQDIDKISYDIEADPESKDETVLNMMRKVPLLTVDADDNVQLKGSSSYRILINGKASGLFANNPRDVLRSMPASSVKKIEVITNPPAKYEAEGVGGIINIITVKKTPSGYNGSVNAGLRHPLAYNAGAYLTVKTGEFGFSGNYGSNSWVTPENRSNFARTDKQTGDQLLQTGLSDNQGLNHYGNAQFSFEPDSLNLFTAGLVGYGGFDDNDRELTVRFFTENALAQEFRRWHTSSDRWKGYDLSLDYQRSFRRNADQLFTLSYKRSLNQSSTLADFKFLPVLNYAELTANTENTADEGENTWQADYVHPFGKHTLETGLKTIFRSNNSTYFYALLQPDNQTFKIDPSQSNDFDYFQDIYAGYVSVSLKRDKWGLKLGSRLEETKVEAAFKSSGTFARQDYFNVIPSAALSRRLTESQDVKLSYTQRLQRPGLWFLNPYTDRTDPKNISRGNPKVAATISHSFEAAHSVFIKSSSLNSSVFYTFTNNAIQQVTTFYPDSAVTTFANTGKEQNLGFTLSTNLNPTNKLGININGSYTYLILNGFANGLIVRNTGSAGSLFGSVSYKTDKKWRFSLNTGFQTRNILLQGRNGGYVYNSFSFGRTFLKDDKLTLNVNLNNPFTKNRTWKNELEDARISQFQHSTFQIRRFGVSFNYKFGQLKGGIVKKKRGIENDDVKGGKSGGGG